MQNKWATSKFMSNISTEKIVLISCTELDMPMVFLPIYIYRLFLKVYSNNY